jgi:hypothetical protein
VSYILRMNRQRMPELLGHRPAPSLLLQILMFTGFCAEINLLNVARALGQKNHAAFSVASEANAKLPRIRTEIDEQVAMEMAKPQLDDQLSQKLIFISNIALFFEKIGAQTVELAGLCEQLIRRKGPGPLSDIQKLMENAVYMADSAAAAFVYDELIWAKSALERGRASATLHDRIKQNLASLGPLVEDSPSRVNLLSIITSKTREIIEQTSQMAERVIALLDSPNVSIR